MCGICGRLHRDPTDRATVAALRPMMDAIRHRGPDGEGEFVEGPIALGHRRLSIIDLATGAQPMANETGEIVVAYNGEIYNFRELRAELQAAGHSFRSTSDTEVIVHLYEEEGDACVRRLRGMFAFALWDARRARLLLARDRVGVKPLYYALTPRTFLFASELKSLLADATVDRSVDARAIDRFLTYYYLPGDETPFASIRKLPPAHCLVVENGRVSVTRYWDLRFSDEVCVPGFREATHQLRELLARSVADHMISDVPVGVLLSGGVDSSGVLAYASKQAGQPMHTFTVGFAGERFADERPYARMAAQAFNAVHHEMSMSATDFRDGLATYVWHMEEPVCEPPAVALHAVARMARDASVKVLLSGEGGDEAFAGYQTYRNLVALERLKSAAGVARPLLQRGFRAVDRAGLHRVGKYAPLVDEPLSAYYLSRSASPLTPFNRNKDALYRADVASRMDHCWSVAPTARLFDALGGLQPLSQMLYVDTHTWLPDDLLLKADKMTMAASVELRVPLLDHRVLEFAATLPTHYKVRGWELKRILKAALRDCVPRPILKRRKSGFPVPYDTWMRNELSGFVRDIVLSRDGRCDTYFDRAAVRRLLDAHQQDGAGAKEVFSLLVLAMWHQRFAPQMSLARAA